MVQKNAFVLCLWWMDGCMEGDRDKAAVLEEPRRVGEGGPPAGSLPVLRYGILGQCTCLKYLLCKQRWLWCTCQVVDTQDSHEDRVHSRGAPPRFKYRYLDTYVGTSSVLQPTIELLVSLQKNPPPCKTYRQPWPLRSSLLTPTASPLSITTLRSFAHRIARSVWALCTHSACSRWQRTACSTAFSVRLDQTPDPSLRLRANAPTSRPLSD